MNSEIISKYESVIGLEVHAQLLTNSKAYSSDVNEFGAQPNHNISPITLGHPGTLPVMNEKTIEFAIKLGLALKSSISKNQYFARKNYFYPDLPKGYQITQDKTPICTGGEIIIQSNGEEKRFGVTRIHMEEDAGKSLHDVDLEDTLVDLNRAGTPLLEIVSEPDLRSSQDAYDYLTEIRKIVRYLNICDGNMEEGSLRCDANISVRLKGSNKFGTKVEVKNMNSIRNVQKAIDFEINRQINCLENNLPLFQETRGFNALNGTTISMRTKEAANDYRYFPEPDLQPLFISQETIDKISNTIPKLPSELFKIYTVEYGLSEYDANNLIESKPISQYYNKLVQCNGLFKQNANWVMGEIKSYLNENGIEISNFPISAEKISKLILLVHQGKISHTSASNMIFPNLLSSNKDPLEIAEQLNLLQDNSEELVLKLVKNVLDNFKKEVERYINGEKQLIGFFMGELMKLSKGKVNPKSLNTALRNTLDSKDEK